MVSSSWSDERIAVLRRLWLAGSSAAEIAKALGRVTRNAVIGKIHRLGLAGRVPPSGPHRGRAARAPGQAVRRIAPRSPPPPSPPRPPAAPARARRPAVETLEAVARVFDMTALTARTCRWPIGDPLRPGFGFCGDAVDGAGPYCRGHREVACPDRLQRPVEPLARAGRQRAAARSGWARPGWDRG